MAVEESAKILPTTKAAEKLKPNKRETAVKIKRDTPTYKLPTANTKLFMASKRGKENSNPNVKRRNTIPSSAKCS